MEPLQAMDSFFSEEIRGDYDIAKYFLDWIKHGISNSTSGNAFFLEKRDNKIVIGNLYDDDFPETEVSTQDFIEFINTKLANASK